MTTKRAKAGGEYGANGEWYEGGKFINTVPENAKRYGSTPKGSGKQEIEPYRWEIPPDANSVSLFRKIAGIIGRYDRRTARFVYAGTPRILAWVGMTEQQAKDLIERYNAGERWTPRQA